MTETLPLGWDNTTVEDLSMGIQSGTGFPKKYQGKTAGDYPFAKVGTISAVFRKGQKFISEAENYVSEDDLLEIKGKPFPSGSIVFPKIGEALKGNYRVVSTCPMLFDNNVMGVIPDNAAVVTDYLYNFLKTKDFAEFSVATAVPSIRKGDVGDIKIPVPPLNEQHRIVEKIDALMERSGAAKEALDAIPTLLDQYRQSVLAAAFRGDLTKDWRKKNPNVEPAETLLERIASLCSGQLKVRASKQISQNIKLFNLPQSWCWATNHKLAEDNSNAICAGPFGTIFKAKDFRNEGVPIIFLRHVLAGKYSTRKPGFMDTKVWEEKHQPYSIYGGELLVTKLGDPPGTSCISPEGVGAAMVTPDVIKMSVNQNAVLTKLLMYFFNSPHCKKIAGELAFGVTRLRIDLTMFKHFPIPLPPLEEQHELVKRIDTAMTFIEKIERSYNSSVEQLPKLNQSILAKAFRGELVPQDPTDEPASVLLERIRTERASQPPVKTRRKKAK